MRKIRTQEPSSSRKTTEVVAETHCDHDDTPQNHNGWNEDARPQALEEDVGQRLKKRVGNEKNGEGGIVLARGHVKILRKAINFGISNVSSAGLSGFGGSC